MSAVGTVAASDISYSDLSSRLLNNVVAPGYKLAIDLGDTSYMYILEAPIGTAVSATGWRGIRLTLTLGSISGEVQYNIGATLTYNNRKTDANWTS